ncbi:ABC transporter ATP-binding protein [Bosea sp. AS-1]|uniref:ABC transporter ATP-binding protein n=1 Tax=Bosea sp. AS-1 TaxID=2015316 RepID=UPI000B790C5C|nr:ABC transporter ATP-binding protein [Bosea sp. AS-1]
MSSAIAITCQGVSKRFALVDGGSAWRLAFGASKDVPVYQALHDISFTVPKGQFVGVLGRNGAGKSTLLRVVGGVYAADEGRVAVNGAMSAIYELGLVGNPELTGRAYADRLLTVHGFSRRERAEMIADIHDFSELGDRFEDPVLTYSAGMTARLFFATATAGSYDVYLLDEILSVGDQHFQAKCWRRLRDRISGGASGVLVTHDWSAIVRMCETAYVLDKGKVTFGGPAERAARLYLYGEDAREAHHAGIAKLLSRPQTPIAATAGKDLDITVDVLVETAAEVGCTFVIERLQPGFGWETALMSRDVAPIGSHPGEYQLAIRVPKLPLEPGSYQISLHLVMPDRDVPGRRIILDGWSWLNGNGLSLDIVGDAMPGAALPLHWRVGATEAIA